MEIWKPRFLTREQACAHCGPSQGPHDPDRWLNLAWLILLSSLSPLRISSQNKSLWNLLLFQRSALKESTKDKPIRQAYKSEHQEKPRQESKCDSAKKQRPSCPTTPSQRNHVCFLWWGIWDTRKLPISTYTSTKKVEYSTKIRTWPHAFPLATLAITWMNVKLLVSFSNQSQGLMIVAPNWDHTLMRYP